MYKRESKVTLKTSSWTQVTASFSPFIDLDQELLLPAGVDLNRGNIRCEPHAWEGIMDIQTNNYVTGEPTFAVDRLGVIVIWNEAAEKALGHPASDALGAKCWRLLSGEDTYGNRYCCRHCAIREMAFNHEPVNSFEFTCKTASNQPRHFTVSCLTVFNKPGNDILLHICHPKKQSQETGYPQAPASTSANHQFGTLSQREIEVLSLLAAKTSTRNIASRMSISIRTVRTHIQHLMYKLQVHKRRDAVRMGKRLRLI